MKLYDMEQGEWRDGLEGGDHWRSKQVYICSTCGCETNEFIMMKAYWGSGPRIRCPGKNVNHELHNLLQDKVVNSRHREHPKKYLEQLQEDIEELRLLFKDVPPNVEGIEGEWVRISSHYW